MSRSLLVPVGVWLSCAGTSAHLCQQGVQHKHPYLWGASLPWQSNGNTGKFSQWLAGLLAGHLPSITTYIAHFIESLGWPYMLGLPHEQWVGGGDGGGELTGLATQSFIMNHKRAARARVRPRRERNQERRHRRWMRRDLLTLTGAHMQKYRNTASSATWAKPHNTT